MSRPRDAPCSCNIRQVLLRDPIVPMVLEGREGSAVGLHLTEGPFIYDGGVSRIVEEAGCDPRLQRGTSNQQDASSTMKGALHTSRTSQPPRLTPRTFSSAQEHGAACSILLLRIRLFEPCQPKLSSVVEAPDLRRGLSYSGSAKRKDCAAKMHFCQCMLMNMRA